MGPKDEEVTKEKAPDGIPTEQEDGERHADPTTMTNEETTKVENNNQDKNEKHDQAINSCQRKEKDTKERQPQRTTAEGTDKKGNDSTPWQTKRQLKWMQERQQLQESQLKS